MRRRAASMLVLLVGLAGFVGLSPTATSATSSFATTAAHRQLAQRAQSADQPYGDPMAKYIFAGRVADNYDTPAKANVNYAVAWLRITDYSVKERKIFEDVLYSEFDRYRRKFVDMTHRQQRTAAEIEQTDPELYEALARLGLRPDDVVLQVVARSVRFRGHSEELILRRLGEIEYWFEQLQRGAAPKQIQKDLQTKNRVPITPKRLIGGKSEREPCSYSGGPQCGRYSKGLDFMVPHGTEEETRKSTGRIADLIRSEKALRAQTGAGPFDPPPIGGSSGAPNSGSKAGSGTAAPSEPGPLNRMAARATIGDPGGIDFSTLELRHLSAMPENRLGFNYGFTARPSSRRGDPAAQKNLQEASDAFFVWLALDRSKFWVNLNPSEPDRIVDRQLGKTDVGRIMLEADLRLKQVDTKLTHPNTKLGKEFWRRLKSYNGIQCLSGRKWITPGVAKVYTKGDELYILEAPLKVQAQPIRIKGTSGRTACPDLPKSINDYNSALYEKLVLPQVVREVNEGPEFAALRRVYLSRIAAEWYRQLVTVRETGLEHLIDGGDISRWTSKQRWTPSDTFTRYVRSLRAFEAWRRSGRGSYRVGGVDFSTVPRRNVSKADFEARWPRMTTGQSYLKGASIPRSRPDTEPPPKVPPPETPNLWTMLTDLAGSNHRLGVGLIAVGGLVILVGLLVGSRRRRTRS